MRRVLLTSIAAITSASYGAAQEGAGTEAVQLPTLTLDSALRTERDILDIPVSASVVERDELERKQASDFEELIGDIPGVSIDGGPRGISQEPNIRGFRDEQIVLRFDGGRFNFGQEHRGRFFIDPDLIQRVEVVRGGGSTLFGSGALGGVISFETRDAADLLDPGDTFGGQVSLGYASNGQIDRGNLSLYGDTGAFDYLFFFGARDFGEDLESGSGASIRNSQIDLVNGLVKLGFEPTEDQRFEFSYSRYEDDGTTPANSSDVSGGVQDVSRDAEVSTFRFGWDYNPSDSDLVDVSVLLYGNFIEITEDRISDGRADRTEYETWGIDITNRSRFDVGIPVDVVYGIEAFRDEQTGIRNGTSRTQFPDATAETIGVFSEATWAFSDRLDLITGLRYDNYNRDPDAPGLASVDEDFFSPRVGFSYRPAAEWQIYANVAQAFRAPSLSELYNDGVHFAVPGFPLSPGATFTGVNRFVPNPDLEEETSTQFELGARFSRNDVWRPGSTLSFSVNAYYADVEDYIDQVVEFIDFSTATPGPGGIFVDGTTRTRNIDAELWGLEAELDYDAGFWFAGAGLSFARGEGDGGEYLGSIPQDRLNLTLGARPHADWEFGLRATFAAEQDRVPTGGTNGDSYEVVDLFAVWEPEAYSNVSVNFGVDNVFDEEYSIYPNGLSQPGRIFKVSSTIRF